MKLARLSIVLGLTLLLTACGSAENEVVEKGEAQTPSSAPANGSEYIVDTEASKIDWAAYKVVGEHSGTINLSEGSFTLDADRVPKAGSFIADMDSITSDNERVTDHLKNSDFFDVPNFPTAKFEVTGVNPMDGQMNGNLTIKDVTGNVSFPFKMMIDGDRFEAKADIAIDRTKWGINYRSPNFFEDLGDSAIKNEFDLSIHIVANKKQ